MTNDKRTEQPIKPAPPHFFNERDFKRIKSLVLLMGAVLIGGMIFIAGSIGKYLSSKSQSAFDGTHAINQLSGDIKSIQLDFEKLGIKQGAFIPLVVFGSGEKLQGFIQGTSGAQGTPGRFVLIDLKKQTIIKQIDVNAK